MSYLVEVGINFPSFIQAVMLHQNSLLAKIKLSQALRQKIGYYGPQFTNQNKEAL
jgi:hypothetical protein